ncbi:hypothetical protein scyTo_0024063 [Scyliorhinus torazame]|uniref:Uncharacterized protein n=1 Tax=Scyliorhinus torazame TaxID=75743 RepID=A0A401QD69_SCYTO|nr:hypothetical protein [Scyliorhinus torazame]
MEEEVSEEEGVHQWVVEGLMVEAEVVEVEAAARVVEVLVVASPAAEEEEVEATVQVVVSSELETGSVPIRLVAISTSGGTSVTSANRPSLKELEVHRQWVDLEETVVGVVSVEPGVDLSAVVDIGAAVETEVASAAEVATEAVMAWELEKWTPGVITGRIGERGPIKTCTYSLGPRDFYLFILYTVTVLVCANNLINCGNC